MAIHLGAPEADIYLESLVPNATAAVNTKSIAPFNAKIREYVETSGNARLHFVDLYAALEEGGVLAPRYQGANTDQSKGINGRAYVKWANLLAEYVDGAKPIAEMSDAKAALNEAMWDALNLVWAGAEGEIVTLAAEAKALIADAVLTNVVKTTTFCNILNYNTNTQDLNTLIYYARKHTTETHPLR